MQTGTILEIYEQELVILTADGQFLRARKLHDYYELGQVIDFTPVTNKTVLKSKNRVLTWVSGNRSRTLAAVAAAIILVAASLFPVYQNNKAYAYMTIDSQASLELTLNHDLEVIGLTPYNKQAEKIADELKWKNQDISTVTNQVFAEMEQSGFTNDSVVISTVYEGKRNKDSDHELKQELNEIQSKLAKNQTDVTFVKGTKDERENAKKQGVSIGEYKQAKQAKEKDKLKKNRLKNKKYPIQNGSEQKQHQKKQEEIKQMENGHSQRNNGTANGSKQNPLQNSNANKNQSPNPKNEKKQSNGKQSKANQTEKQKSAQGATQKTKSFTKQAEAKMES